MSKLIISTLILLLSCTTTDKYFIFKIECKDQCELINLHETNDINTFNVKFWKKNAANRDFHFVAKFDFENGIFSDKSDKGIILEGDPSDCMESPCFSRYGPKLLLNDRYEVFNYEFERLDAEQIKELVKRNILNFGQDPALSDNPKEAAIVLVLKDNQEIGKIGDVIKIISDGYIDLIDAKRKQTKLPTSKLVLDFPLKIQLRSIMTLPDGFKVIDLDDVKSIEQEISIDTIAELKNK